MMYIPNCFVVILLVLYAITNHALAQTQTGPYFISYQRPADCKETNSYAYFFNGTQLRCVACAQNTTLQKTSADGLSCECNDRYFLTYNYGGWIQCAPCPAGQVTAFNKWECVKCSNTTTGTSNPSCPQCTAQTRQITVQQQLNGSYSTPNPSQTCESCAPYTTPNDDGKQCFRCNQILSMINSSDCSCDSQSGGLCFQSTTDIIATSAVVIYDSESVVSAYFSENAAASTSMCNAKYGNSSACELLANLCTLSMYDATAGVPPTTCSQFITFAGNHQWPPNMPWLYYLDRNDLVLLDEGIPTQFSFPNGKLRFIVGSYSLNGTFLGFNNVTNGLLQLCRNSDDFLNAAYVFGTSYSQECEIPVRMFWDETKYPAVLYDLWLEYDTESETKIYAIPVAMGNENLDPDSSNYNLYRRFFLVDNVIGKGTTGGPTAGAASAIRYAKDIAIIIRLQDNQNSGLIYPPYVLINYVSAFTDDFDANTIAKVTFRVQYHMSVTKYETGTAIAVGVLVGVSLLYAGLRTWSWSKRTGRVTVDFMTLIKFLLLSCGYVANSLFVVALGAAIFWWILYKNQGTVVMVVPSSTNSLFIVYLAVGFALKFIDVVHIVLSQSYINIFLIDWERPETIHSVSPEHKEKRQRDRERPVSIWRTYFVANEWNELQTLRKINPTFQIISSVFFLSVVGFGNLATEDPYSNFQLNDPNKYYAPTSYIFRFGIFGMVYLIIALAQWLFFVLIYDRFFEDKLTEYIDFCSMNNISVFVLDNEFFGYYIHGRSVHGRADVGLREMHENFAREERDLCSKRGLLPDSDQQTFQMALPRKLKAKYDRILMPVLAAQAQGGSAVAGAQLRKAGGAAGDSSIALDPNVALSIEAYGRINQLLQGFLDHTLKDVDYSVVDKSFLEQVLDVEFKDPTERGYFYKGIYKALLAGEPFSTPGARDPEIESKFKKDNGHSFDSLFFFGNEIMLIVFEMLFFGLLDLGTKNYLFTGAMQYLLMEVLLKRFRESLGKKNLARKTLVDKRFLI